MPTCAGQVEIWLRISTIKSVRAVCVRERVVGEREIASMFYIVRLKVFFILFPNIVSGI